MKANELRGKTREELAAELVKLREDQFKLRIQHATGQLGQYHLLKETRRELARLKTVMAERAGK